MRDIKRLFVPPLIASCEVAHDRAQRRSILPEYERTTTLPIRLEVHPSRALGTHFHPPQPRLSPLIASHPASRARRRGIVKVVDRYRPALADRRIRSVDQRTKLRNANRFTPRSLGSWRKVVDPFLCCAMDRYSSGSLLATGYSHTSLQRPLLWQCIPPVTDRALCEIS